MALLTDEQLHVIREIIRRHHQAFTVNVIGPESVPPVVLQELQDAGLIDTELTSIEDAYKYGQALAAGTNPNIANMSLAEFRRWLAKNPIPLTQQERRAIDIAQHRAAEYAVGLGNRVGNGVGERILRADRELAIKLRDEVRTKTAENIARRESISELVSDLKWMSKDWGRDWNRIAITEKVNAMQQGQADHLAKRYGPDTLVAKQPAPDACKHCIRLHLGPDGQPRIFKLRDLEANGTNVGRKANDWKATVGPIHPHCQCQLIRIPPGWGFDDNGSLVPGGELGVRYESAEDLQLSLMQEDDLRKGKLQGHVEFQGIPIAIENKAGTKRQWKTPEGESGETLMLYAYGYVKRTQGADAEEVDVYVGPDPRAGMVYIVHQLDPITGRYDEDKCFVGFRSAAAARVAYHAHMNVPTAFGGMSHMDVAQFKRWLGETEPMPGHSLEPDETYGRRLGTIAYTVPMEKAALKVSGTVSTEEGAQTSAAGDRAPGHGTMVNFMEGNVGRHRPKTHPAMIGFDPNEVSPGDMEKRRQKTDEMTYTVPLQRDRANQTPRPVDDAEAALHVGSGIDDDVDTLRVFVDKQAAARAGVQNRVHVEDGVD